MYAVNQCFDPRNLVSPRYKTIKLSVLSRESIFSVDTKTITSDVHVQKVRRVKRIFPSNLLKCSKIVVIVLRCVREACVWHADKVASPSNLSLIEQGVYVASKICFQVEYVLTLVKLVIFILPRLN